MKKCIRCNMEIEGKICYYDHLPYCSFCFSEIVNINYDEYVFKYQEW